MFFLLCAIASICSCSIDSRLRSLDAETKVLDVAQQEYQLRPGDQLTLFYAIKQVVDTCRYLLEPGDQIRIVVGDRKELSRLYTIAPDGVLYLPATPPLPAAGKSALEVEASIQASLKPTTVSASIFVSFERFNSLSRELINSLSPLSSQGPYFRTVVDSDSSINLPRIGKFKCAGVPLNALIERIEAVYAKTYSSLQIIPVFENSSMSSVTVLGEVNKAGAFSTSGRVTLSTALGLAGGWMKSAAMESIIVVQREGRRVIVRRINFKNDLITASQLALTAGDIVFVPAKPITDLDVFVDQYIRGVLPVGINGAFVIP